MLWRITGDNHSRVTTLFPECNKNIEIKENKTILLGVILKNKDRFKVMVYIGDQQWVAYDGLQHKNTHLNVEGCNSINI